MEYGKCLADGFGAIEGSQAATANFRLAAEHGVDPALIADGERLVSGSADAKDEAAAAAACKQAAGLGRAEEFMRLGQCGKWDWRGEGRSGSVRQLRDAAVRGNAGAT
jgi:hypothetical protein